MARKGPFKKDLTPIGRGGITKHVGKGASEMSGPGRGALTGGSPFDRMAGQYPKPTPPPAPEPEEAPMGPSEAPMGPPPGAMPTASMPPPAMGGNDEEAE